MARGGPDNFGYRWVDNLEIEGPVHSFNNIKGTGTLSTVSFTDDGVEDNIPIGFIFPYYGQEFTKLWISSNGLLGFGASSTSAIPEKFPSVVAPSNCLSPFWDDLNLDTGSGGGGDVYYQNIGDEFIVQWQQVQPYNSSGVYTFQVSLKATGEIKFIYKKTTGDRSSMSIGVNNANGDDGLNIAFADEGPFGVAGGRTVQILPPDLNFTGDNSPFDESVGGFFHFVLRFYADPETTQLVSVVDSRVDWNLFTGNGVRFTEDGIFIPETQCIDIEFRLPFDDPREELFDRVLYVKVSAPIPNITNNPFDIGVDIVIVVDESGSMATEHAWIGDMAISMDNALQEAGFVDNRFALVGFGYRNFGHLPREVSLGFVSEEDGNGNLVETEELRYIGTASEIKPATSQLGLDGSLEDGYKAIRNTIFSEKYKDIFQGPGIRPKHVILVTDEDRDILFDKPVSAQQAVLVPGLATEITYGIILDMLFQTGVNLAVVINGEFEDSEGNRAIGIEGVKSFFGKVVTSRAMIPDASRPRLFKFSPGGRFVQIGAVTSPSDGSGSSNTKFQYVDLALASGGTAWDLNLLRSGGFDADSFTSAFVNTQVLRSLELTLCQNEATPNLIEFFCKKEEPSSIDIDVDVTNDPYTFVPNKHYRITFYADKDKNSVVYSAFSLLDQRRWFVEFEEDPIAPQPMGAEGIPVNTTENIKVVYKPEFLPIELLENQSSHELENASLENSVFEKALICGVTYFVDIEEFHLGRQDFKILQQIEKKFTCKNSFANIWRKDEQSRKWGSSGQGKIDFRITDTAQHTLFPSVTGNASGQFMIAWQDHRNSNIDSKKIDYNPQIFYGLWDTVNDVVWSSGQGWNDQEIINFGFRPKTSLDLIQNFWVGARQDNTMRSFFCPLLPPPEQAPITSKCLLTDDKFAAIDGVNRDAQQFLKARVFDADSVGSFIISEDEVASVVEDCSIRLDILGVPGVYAVRLRNEDERQWSDWINIDPELCISEEEDNLEEGETFNRAPAAYKIDNERFISPWVLSPGSGMKRISIQVLNFFGVSPTFDITILANIKELEYDVELYYDEEMTIKAPLLNGVQIITDGTSSSSESTDLVPQEVTEETTTETDTEESEEVMESGRDIFVKIIFKDKQKLKEIMVLHSTKFRAASENEDFLLTFNVLQQGLNDLMNIPLTEFGIEEDSEILLEGQGIFTGKFKIERSDGIYNKDGLAAIVVNIPNPCTRVNSILPGGNQSDILNRMDLGSHRDSNIKYDGFIGELSPQKLLEEYKESRLSRVVDINSLKRLYDKDDPRFMFGDPKYFMKKS